MVRDSTFDYFEWEWLGNPASFENVKLESPISLHSEKLVVQRDPDYSLIIDIELQDQPYGKSPFSDLVGKNSPSMLTFSAEHDSAILTISDCVCMHARELGRSDGKPVTTTYTLFTPKVTHEWKERKDPRQATRLTEWFINGIYDIHLYSGSTVREYSQGLTRTRRLFGTEEKHDPITLSQKTGSSSRDFFSIPYGEWKIVVPNVPDGIGPIWSKNIGIEYLCDEGWLFPSKEERAALSELVSFFFGKRLIRVGSTTYDEHGDLITRKAYQKIYCPVPERFSDEKPIPPVKYSDLRQNGGIGRQIGDLLPRYLQLRADIKLDEIFFNLWLANDDPLERRIPTYVTGIEQLAKNWFKSQHSRIKGVYISEEDYRLLIAPEIVSLQEKFSSVDDGQKILNKIYSAYQMSTSDRYVRLYDELNLEIGDVEADVFKNRNKFSHGHTLSSGEEIREAMKLSLAARSLFNRTVLRILNYSGTYLDHYLDEPPVKALEIPLGV